MGRIASTLVILNRNLYAFVGADYCKFALAPLCMRPLGQDRAKTSRVNVGYLGQVQNCVCIAVLPYGGLEVEKS